MFDLCANALTKEGGEKERSELVSEKGWRALWCLCSFWGFTAAWSDLRTVFVLESWALFTACSVALCEYGTCVFRLYCLSVSISPFACRSHGRLVAAVSNKLGSHMVQGGSAALVAVVVGRQRGEKSMRLCFGATLNGAQIFAMIWAWQISNQLAGLIIHHARRAYCASPCGQFPCRVLQRWTVGDRPSATHNEAEVSARKLKQCQCKGTPQLPTDRLLCAAVVSRINLQQAVKQTGRYPSQADSRTETHL